MCKVKRRARHEIIGICENTDCEYCEFQEPQEVEEVDQEGKPVCKGCKKPLKLLDPDDNREGNGNKHKKLKRILIIISSILILGGIVFGVITLVKSCSCNKPDTEIEHPITPDSITLDKTSLEFKNVGECDTLTATVYPDSVLEKNKEIFWRSSDETVATVDANGIVTAVANGNAVISAYTGNGLSDTCYVKVGIVIGVTHVTLNKPALSLKAKATEQLIATVYPEGATNKEVDWLSDNPAVATVNSTGLVTAVAKGTANITVKTVDGGKIDSSIIKVEISAPCGSEKKYSFGKYSGGMKYSSDLKVCYPDGQGTMIYLKHIRIAKHDSEVHYAEVGYSAVGTWINGDISNVKLIDKNGNIVEVILAGARNSVYNLENDK